MVVSGLPLRNGEADARKISTIIIIKIPDLIFVTDITDYTRGKKICHVEKFQISVKNLNNLWSSIEIYAVFVLNLCGEKSVWKKITNMSFAPDRCSSFICAPRPGAAARS